MRISTLIAIVAFLGFGTASAFSLNGRGGSPVTLALDDKANALPILNYLLELGQDHDCFFTIEEAWRPDDLTDSIVNHWLQISPQKRSLKGQLEELQRTIPNLGYEIEKVNPKIVHIKDRRLARQKDYGLEGVIKKIDFAGKVHDLVSEINRQGVPVSAPLITFTNETLDYDTIVQLKGEGLKVRDALSNVIQLEGRRGRILWIARTQIGERQMTYVRYP